MCELFDGETLFSEVTDFTDIVQAFSKRVARKKRNRLKNVWLYKMYLYHGIEIITKIMWGLIWSMLYVWYMYACFCITNYQFNCTAIDSFVAESYIGSSKGYNLKLNQKSQKTIWKNLTIPKTLCFTNLFKLKKKWYKLVFISGKNLAHSCR